ncbi:NAD(P)-dependent oxidoreductase [Hallerella sp.]|nr:NAD(P)-dependent oxidoreductase [Hallerella sp.]MCI6873762.1 adenosylhomocysteinase [Hallerella sp.]
MLFEDLIQEHYDSNEYPALAALAEEWEETRPFEGLKVLVATPIFRNSLVQYEALIAGGADLYAGRTVEGTVVPCDVEIVELLQESEIPVLSPEMVLDMEQEDDYFDLILDCAGQFSACHPRIGFVELTKTGVPYYEDVDFPVFIADSGIIKRIETSLGTGDGYFRGLEKAGYSNFEKKKFVVFGSGKVGCGIALQGLSRGAEVVTVTDTSRRNTSNDFILTLEANGIEVVDKNDSAKVSQRILDADFVVTATGMKDALASEALQSALANTKAVLANMGVEDEFSEDFPEERVLNKKLALNFSLEEPTHLKYIDASLALHAALGERLVLERDGVIDAEDENSKGLRNPPAEIEQKLLGITMQNGIIGAEIAEMMGFKET